MYPTVTSARSCNNVGHLFWFTILAQHETNDVILYIHSTKFKFILDDTSNFPPLVPIQEVNRAYFVSRYFIGRKDFRNFFLACSSRQYPYHVTRFVIFFSGAFITHWLKRFTFHFYSYLKLPLNRPLDTKWIGRA
jgi:hypothetical protein